MNDNQHYTEMNMAMATKHTAAAKQCSSMTQCDIVDMFS